MATSNNALFKKAGISATRVVMNGKTVNPGRSPGPRTCGQAAQNRGGSAGDVGDL